MALCYIYIFGDRTDCTMWGVYQTLIDVSLCCVWVACVCRYKTSQELIGHDPHSNTYNYKYSFSVEIVPVCKNDIVCLPPKLSQQLGNFGPLAVCQRVTSSVQLVDPHTLRGTAVAGYRGLGSGRRRLS